jgi:hypothetical protein
MSSTFPESLSVLLFQSCIDLLLISPLQLLDCLRAALSPKHESLSLNLFIPHTLHLLQRLGQDTASERAVVLPMVS